MVFFLFFFLGGGGFRVILEGFGGISGFRSFDSHSCTQLARLRSGISGLRAQLLTGIGFRVKRCLGFRASGVV